jgi:hypothetical protein
MHSNVKEAALLEFFFSVRLVLEPTYSLTNEFFTHSMKVSIHLFLQG